MSEATAVVTGQDGQDRTFVAGDGEVLHYKGRKHVYLLWAEPEGRGFIVMQRYDGSFGLAPTRFQPIRIFASSWAGEWYWEKVK